MKFLDIFLNTKSEYRSLALEVFASFLKMNFANAAPLVFWKLKITVILWL